MTKPQSKKPLADIPDIRADEPERAMAQFTAGLRRVLAAPKRNGPTKQKRKARHR